MEITADNRHVLLFPFPAQGHIIPLLDLAHNLAGRGLAVTVVVTAGNRHFLDPIRACAQPLIFPFPSDSSIPPGIENTKDIHPSDFVPMIAAMRGLHTPLKQWFLSHPSPPASIISDMFLGWTHHLAGELGIRRLVFSPSAAMTLSVIYSLWTDLPKPDDPNDANSIVSFREIPNLPSYPWWQLSPLYRSYVEGSPFSEFLKDCFLSNIASWGLVVNSFHVLESEYINHLKTKLGHSRVWAVGPLHSSTLETTSRGGASTVPVNDLLSRLDTCADGSVLLISFGTQAVLSNRLIDRLATALEESGVPFVWSLKAGQAQGGDCGVVPVGFEDRTAGRGLVIRGWVPQITILRHRAVGAFLTHCGWNSILEAAEAGVPLLTWPMGADQFIDATLVVDVLSIGRRACEGAEHLPEGGELTRTMKEFVGGQPPERHLAAELSKAARDAVGSGGSSEYNIQNLVNSLIS